MQRTCRKNCENYLYDSPQKYGKNTLPRSGPLSPASWPRLGYPSRGILIQGATYKVNMHKRTVPRWFRELCDREFQALGENYGLWRLLEFLAFSPARRDQRGLQVSTRLLAHLEGRERDLKNGRYVGHTLLTAFSTTVARLKIKPWSRGEDCRRVLSVDWPQSIRDAIATVLTTRPKPAERVYLCDGRSYTYARHKVLIEQNRARAVEEAEKAGCIEARNLLDLLNGLPPNRFTSMLKHWDAAMARAIELDTELTARDPSMEHYYAKILQEIKDYAKPLYRPVERSLRVFTTGFSIQNLHVDLRAILCQDWQECDLASSHLSVCAATWNVPLVTTFLDTGCSIWTTLSDDYAQALTPALKAALKKALYALVYGDSKRNITVWLRMAGLDEAVFYRHPVIDAMYEVRQGVMAGIKSDNGARDCFGRWITTTHFVPCKVMVDGVETDSTQEELDVKSILAQLSQSMEFKILYPAVELAMQHSGDEGFAILLWQWDGFSIACKESLLPRWQRVISDTVNRNARALGVHTSLMWKTP